MQKPPFRVLLFIFFSLVLLNLMFLQIADIAKTRLYHGHGGSFSGAGAGGDW